MKKITLLILFTFPFLVLSQTLISYDNIESSNWTGSGWTSSAGTWYYNNFSVSPSSSAVLTGSGGGTSSYETGTYFLPNRTGLNPSSTYTLKFRVASYKITSPSSATAGVDAGDYFDIQYSSNGGTSYVTEKRITGFSNGFWDYNTNGVSWKVASNSLNTYSPASGGNRTSTGDGYSVISLILPNGITQCAFRIVARANSAGEEWWFDNFELWEETAISLPIELISFSGEKNLNYNELNWSTATERDNDYFILEYSENGNDWELISRIPGAGNSIEIINYSFPHYGFNKSNINYYRLSQFDYDGKSKEYPVISMDNRGEIEIEKILDLSGREVQENYMGIILIYFKGGGFEKRYKY